MAKRLSTTRGRGGGLDMMEYGNREVGGVAEGGLPVVWRSGGGESHGLWGKRLVLMGECLVLGGDGRDMTHGCI